MSMDQDPWGGGRNQTDDFIDSIKNFFLKKKKSPSDDDQFDLTRVVLSALGGLLVIWAIFGIFIVSPAEEGVVLRFGRYVKTVQPGPHWVLPLIEKEYVLNVQQISTFPYQAEMLTEDENIVSVAVAVQFRVANPRDFLFNVVDPVNTLKQATSSALRQAVGQMTLDGVLTTGRKQLRNDVSHQLKETLDRYKTGLQIMDVALQATRPPEAVAGAFNDAVKAREDSQRYINQAQAYARRVLLSAKGGISRLENDANAYKQSVVLTARGDVARYNAFLSSYKKAPQVTSKRLYLDTVKDVLSHTTNVIVDGNHNLLYLPLEQMLQKQMQLRRSATYSELPDSKGSAEAIQPREVDKPLDGRNYHGSQVDDPIGGRVNG